jgi:hypothetical protein
MMKKSPALLDHCCDLVVYPTAGAVVVQTKVPWMKESTETLGYDVNSCSVVLNT